MLRFIKEKPTIPQLRFGFGKKPFERRRLDEVSSKKISYGIVQAGDHVPGGMPYIKSQDLNGLLTLERLERTSAEIARKYRRSEVEPGDIVFSLRGNIGVAQIVPDSIAVSNLTQGTARISVGEDYNKYVSCALQSLDVVRQLQAYAKGSTFREISLEDLRKVTVALPILPEQRKIADFLTAVDGRIQQLSRKKALLENYKKGVMQQLFTQAIRFKDDDGNDFPDWEEAPLQEFMVERNTQFPKSETHPLMAFIANKGVAPKGDRYNRDFLVKDNEGKKYKQTEYGDFIYSSNNLESGSIGLNSFGSASISPVYSIFYFKENCNSEFIGRMLLRKPFIYEMTRYRQGVVYGQWRIHEASFLGIKQSVPSVHEQKKIADFLSAIDSKIESVTIQIAETQTFKKGLLQQMFV